MKSLKSFFKFAALLLALQQSVIHAFAQPSTPQASTWITDGNVNAVAYAKGLTYIGGDFTYVGPNTGYGAASSTTTGAPDLKFPKVNGQIYVVTADGTDGWYIGGNFTKVGDFTRNWIARIKADGTVDPDWDPNASGNPSSDIIHIHTIVVHDSTVYVGGSFTNIGGQPRDRIAALNATTGQATSWNPNASSWVRTIAIKDQTVYVGGRFTSIGGQTRKNLAALDMTTGNATAWNPTIIGEVLAIVAADTSIFAGGQFTSAGGLTRKFLAEFGMTSGQVTVWNPSASAQVVTLVLNGTTLYAGGNFTQIGGLPRRYMAALSIHSSTPLSWNPNSNSVVYAIYLNGSTIYVGGDFTNIGGQQRNRLAALDATTAKATAWSPFAPARIRGLALNTDGSILYAGGNFRSIGGQSRNRLAAINASTGIVTTWNPASINGSIYTIALSSSNVYIGGAFTSPRNRIAAINATTGATTAWNPNANGNVHAISIDNSTVYVGGKFTAIGGQTRNLLAALDINTGLVTGWNPNVSAVGVYTILANGDTIYAGGDFNSVSGQSRQALAAIDANTGQATAWNPNLNASSIVYAIALDGSTLYIGGDFNTVKGQTRNRLAAVDSTTADPTGWNPNANGIVRVLALSGSNVYAGGAFTSIGAQTRNFLAAIDKATGIPADWNPNPNNFGSGQGLVAVGSAILAGGAFTTMGGNMQGYFAQFGDIVATNNPPHAPSAVNQYKSDATTVISEGGTSDEKKVIFKATVSDPDDDQVKLQIELRKITEAFIGTPTRESLLVNSGTPVSIMRDTLAAAGYKWRYRVMDVLGLATAWVEFGTPGNTDFVIVINGAPTLAAVNQFKSDATTVIAEGGKTNEKKVVFKATVSDPNNDPVKLQIELRKFNEAFTGLPNSQSGLVNSGAPAVVIRDSLVDANYKWRYRALDANGLASAWVDFGAPANTDFIVATNKPPAAPTTLKQLKADGITAIPEGGTTSENKVVFKATVSDPDGEQVRLQIELRRTIEPFPGVPNTQSVLVNSGAQATITIDGLAWLIYKWRCRTVDARGLTSAWVEFGSPGNTDFVVNRPPTVYSVSQFKSNETTVILEGGTTNETKIVFKAAMTDPDGDQIKLEIELRKMVEAFTSTPNLQSNFRYSENTVGIAKDSLTFTDYKWRYRAMDNRGLASDWKEYGTPGNIDFTVAPEIPIYPAAPSPQNSGKEFWVDIFVGTKAKPVSNLFGVSLVLNFSPYNYIDVVTPYESAVMPGSFMGTDVVLYQTVEENYSRVNVGISRKAGQSGVNGDGVILRVKFLARADTPDSTQAMFNITNVKANDPQGKTINLTPKFKSITIINKNVLVWPGDTNNDSVVNQADILPIGLHWGSKGPARQNASMNWMGQPSAAWTPFAATHANANGDSIVNQGEISAIGLNWGKYHYPTSLLADGELEKSQAPTSATIMPEIIPAVQPPNREFLMKIKVAEVSNLFGLSFELAYDQPQLLQALAVEPDSLFGSDVVFYSNTDAANGKIAVGISRKAGQASVNRAGSVVRVKAKIAATATVGTKINFSLQNVTANDAKGAAMSLSPQAASLTVSNITGIDSDGETSAPASYRLLQNHPNPFNAGTLIKYEIPQAGPVSVKIYNLAGQETLELVNAVQQPGRYQINWNGRDSHGKTLPSGVYICRIQAGSFVQAQRMIMVR